MASADVEMKFFEASDTLNALLEQLARFGVGRLTAILGLTAGAAAALVFFTTNMNSNGEALLFSGLQPNDAAAVSERLDSAGISYSLREGGSAVYVNTAQVDEARMRVASDGALGFGSVGYEIFDNTDALGTTGFVQNVNAKRALEGELARSINTINNVATSRVLLVLPERRLFARDQESPSASVILTVQGDLTRNQVQTIRNLVATAVPGLSPNRITIADNSGRLLASPNEGGELGGTALDDQRTSIEENLRQKIINVVEGIVGSGAARVVVTAELTRESQTSRSLIYDPNTQVEVSRRQETANSTDPQESNAVSVSEYQPDAEETTEATAQLATSNRELTERNYQNSSTETNRVLQAGAISALAVSVVVDELTGLDEEGNLVFSPRSEEQMAQIRSLVAAAAGFPVDADQRDESQILEVQQMRFSRPDLTAGSPAPQGFSINDLDIMRITELVILFITSILIIFLVARPLVQGASGGFIASANALAGTAGTVEGMLVGPDGELRPGQVQLPTGEISSDGTLAMLPESGESMLDDEHIDVAQIEGQVKKSSVRKIATLIEQHPDESMTILRSWMHKQEVAEA